MQRPRRVGSGPSDEPVNGLPVAAHDSPRKLRQRFEHRRFLAKRRALLLRLPQGGERRRRQRSQEASRRRRSVDRGWRAGGGVRWSPSSFRWRADPAGLLPGGPRPSQAHCARPLSVRFLPRSKRSTFVPAQEGGLGCYASDVGAERRTRPSALQSNLMALWRSREYGNFACGRKSSKEIKGSCLFVEAREES
jgi:hypothetical protein